MHLCRFLPNMATVLYALPGNVEAALALSELYKELGHADKALELLHQHIKGIVTSQFLFLLSFSVENTEEPTIFQQNVLDTQDLRVVTQLGLTHRSMGRDNEFIEVCLPILMQRVPLPPDGERRLVSCYCYLSVLF